MKTNRWLVRSVLLGSVTIIVAMLGCSNEGDNPVVESGYMNVPRVTGLLFADAYGNFIGGWGSVPTVPPPRGLPRDYSTYAFPNPFDNATNVVLRVPVESRTRIWVTRALGPNETQEELEDHFGGGFVTAPGIWLWSFEDTLFAGTSYIQINTSEWPDGFYCCNVESGQFSQQVFIVKGLYPDDFRW